MKQIQAFVNLNKWILGLLTFRNEFEKVFFVLWYLILVSSKSPLTIPLLLFLLISPSISLPALYSLENKFQSNFLSSQNNSSSSFNNRDYYVDTILNQSYIKKENLLLSNLKDKNVKQSIASSKNSIFPCLDYLDLSISNLSQPLKHYKHLIRIYHSSQNLSIIDTLNNYDFEKDFLHYIQEKEIKKILFNQSAIYSFHCNIFLPKYQFYCFRYISIDCKSKKINYESNLFCINTLKDNNFFKEKKMVIKKDEKFYSNYGPSLKLSNTEYKYKKTFKYNNINLVKQLICKCGNNYDLELSKNYLLHLNKEISDCGNEKFNRLKGKVLIKNRKNDFNFCILNLTSPKWIQIKVKSYFYLEKKKGEDLNEIIDEENYLIIRDGLHSISSQINFNDILPTFQYLTTGLLRFEFKLTLGNQFHIELIQSFEKFYFEASNNNLMSDQFNQFENNLNLMDFSSINNFKNTRKSKINQTFYYIDELYKKKKINSFGMKKFVNQLNNLKFLNIKTSKVFKKSFIENFYVLKLIDENRIEHLIVNDDENLKTKLINLLNKSLNVQFLNLTKKDSNQNLNNNFDLLYSISLWVFIFILTSIIAIIYIIFTTKINPPTGNMIDFNFDSNKPKKDFSSNFFKRKNLSRKELTDCKNQFLRKKFTFSSLDNLEQQLNKKNDNNLNRNLSDDDNEILNETEIMLDKSLKFKIKNNKTYYSEDIYELNRRQKMFSNCFTNCSSKDDILSSKSNFTRNSQSSFPTSEVSLELDYYDYLTPFVPKPPCN